MEAAQAPAEPTERHVEVPASSSTFATNKITTSKYTYWSFLPKNLYEQFHKVANIYFLTIAVLQATPVISVSGGVPNILLPLSFVLTVSAVKDYLEDYKRRKSDQEENQKEVQLIADSTWKSTKWEDLQVGNIVKVLENEYFPADLVLLSSSDSKGFCYVETKNLDGETNLKHKSALKELNSVYQTEAQLGDLSLDINCDLPNSQIYTFQGTLQLGQDIHPLDHNQILLRGSSLRNTKHVIGVVIYTGHETKLMKNSAAVRFKYSMVENMMSSQIMYVILLQVTLCLFCALYYTLWFWMTEDDTEQYLDLDSHHNNLFAQFIIAFFSWMLLFTNFVPISLIVTLEMVKYFQAFFIAWDLGLYYEETDTPATVQSSSLNEELGQITHVFSDKTGTLTCNLMEFRKFSVLGQTYGSSQHASGDDKQPFVDFVHPGFEPTPEIMHFMWILAVCHTVIAETNEEGKIVYKAASPDELALVEAAKYFKVQFLRRDENEVVISVDGTEERIALLNVLEFTSDRKRMSVVVRTADGRILLLCKGADTVLKERLSHDAHVEMTEKHLEDFANEGLRTLVIAEKEWEEGEYRAWNDRWEAALRNIADRERLKTELSDEAETGLTLSGATAIEDKLQEGVPTTIAALKKAGIRVWMLTGDKIETAINIGYSCSLLTPHMPHITITGSSRRNVRQQLYEARQALKIESASSCAVIISGEALETLQGDSLRDFVKIAEKCESVLCCRVSPQQKAFIVTSMIKLRGGIRALAIGDGANDVNMITAAHVGVGIAGLEGTQAVRASDFSIAQFRFLQRLMFVHGHECYRRNSALICYNFYKNMLLVLPLFWYGTMSTFSGILLYNMWTYNFYNMFYCFLPIFIYALTDKEKPYEELESTPKYYRPGLRQELFGTAVFWQSILEAALKSIVICFLVFSAVCFYTGDRHNGKDSNIWMGSLTMFLCVVIVSNLRIIKFSYSVSWISIVVIIASTGSYILTHFIMLEWLPIVVILDNYDMRGSLSQMLTNPNVYNVLILLAAICFMFYPIVTYAIELYQILRRKGPSPDDSAAESDTDDTPLLGAPERYSRYTGVISRKHTGFAFSQEAGHAPQITEKLNQR